MDCWGLLMGAKEQLKRMVHTPNLISPKNCALSITVLSIVYLLGDSTDTIIKKLKI